MKNCPKCNIELADDALFCPECGAKFETASTPEEAPAKEPIVVEAPKQKAPPPPAYDPDPKPAKNSKYAPVSAWRYLGIIALLSIPFVGFICTVVWACGGCHRVNVRNLARGILLSYLIVLILVLLYFLVMLVIAIATGVALMPLIEELFYEILYAIY